MATIYSCINQLVGIFCIFLFYGLLGFHIYIFFKDILYDLKGRFGTILSLVWSSIGLILLFNITFNHFWAMLIKPGGPRDLRKVNIQAHRAEYERSKQASKDLPAGAAPSDDIDYLPRDIKLLAKYSEKSMKNLDGIWNRKCHACHELKPARTYHCSICNTCVFQMQHHCVFTNNCVGLENHRFFFLFIFYLLFGTLYYVLSIFAVWHRFIYNYLDHQRLSLLLLMDCMLFFALFFFHIWQWLLASQGQTNVEWMLSMAGYRNLNYDFAFQRLRDNMFKIFGTRNLIRMFSPSLRLNPFTGLEWSFQMKELGFDEFGGLEDAESQRLVRKKKKPQTIEMQENPYSREDEEEEKDMEAV